MGAVERDLWEWQMREDADDEWRLAVSDYIEQNREEIEEQFIECVSGVSFDDFARNYAEHALKTKYENDYDY
jgi:hypothetical protein